MFERLNFHPDYDLIIYEDNLQTIRLMNSEIARINIKLRHVDVAQCWLREVVQNDQIKIDYLSTVRMMTDELTKLLSLQKHKEFLVHLELVNIQSLIDQ